MVIIGGIAGAWFRGSTFDEYWTLYYANPAVPLRQLWAYLSPSETDPPYFYILARFWRDFTGASLFARRLINLIPLAYFLAWLGLTARGKPAYRPFLLVLALFAFTGKFFILHFPEDRGYFFIYCAELVFLGAACVHYLERDGRLDVFQLVALPFLFVLHLVAALYTSVLLVPLLLVDLRRRHYARAGAISLVSLLSLILVGFYIHWPGRQSVLSIISTMPWITPRGPLDAVWTLLSHLAPDLAENWVAFGIAAWVLCFCSARPPGLPVGLIRIIGGAAAAATLIALIINARSPLIVDRYFTFLAVEIMMLVILAILPVLNARPELGALVVANAAIYALASSVMVAHYGAWRNDAAVVAQLAAQCPGTRIHAGALPLDPAEQLGLADIAAPYHLTLLVPGPDRPGRCPVLYWTEEHGPKREEIAVDQGDIAAAANQSAGFGLSPAMLAQTHAIRTKFGVVLEVGSRQGS